MKKSAWIAALTLTTLFSAAFVLSPQVSRAADLVCDGTSSIDNVYVGQRYVWTLGVGYVSTSYIACCIKTGSSYTLYYEAASTCDEVNSDLGNSADTLTSNIPTYIDCGTGIFPDRIYTMPNTAPWNTIPFYINGDYGADSITGAYYDDVIDGGADNDVIYGGPGEDKLIGGADNDILLGQNDADELWGGYDDCVGTDDSEDWLFGGDDAAADDMHGCEGDCDFLFDGNAEDGDECWGGGQDYDYCYRCETENDCDDPDESCFYM